jgi:quercetin dioxygenase-like cupin family protein
VATENLRPHDHPGVESIYTLKGTLSVHIGDEEQRCS